MTCYGSNMNQRRAAVQALPQTSQETAGHPEAVALVSSLGRDVPVRDLLVAGGRRGFTVEHLFGHKTLIEGSHRGTYLQAVCTCGWSGVKREKYGTAKNADGRTVTAREAGMEAAAVEIAAHIDEVTR